MTNHTIKGYYLVRKDSPYKNMSDLRNKTIAMASPLALLSQGAIAELKEAGLKEHENITIQTTTTHNNAIFAVLNKKADAAITGVKIWMQMPERQKKYLRILAKGKDLPGFIIMGNTGLPAETIQNLQNALLLFDTKPAGKKYLFRGFKKIDNATMQSLDAYTAILK